VLLTSWEEVVFMRDFVAFDFETANASRHSICSAGFVFVENGEIVEAKYSLIDPEEEFDNWNVAIHGIHPEDVKGKPTFKEFYQDIRERVSGKVMVAHYLPFDGYALRDNLLKYKIVPTYNQLLCTYQLSKRLIKGLPSYQLHSLCQYFDIELSNHHNALSDAMACAQLMLRLSEQFQIYDLNAIYNKTNIRAGVMNENGFRSSAVVNKDSCIDFRKIKVKESSDPLSPLYGKNIAFTGKLQFFTRKQAVKLVAEKGGKPQKNVTIDTDYIILGDFEEAMIKGKKTAKLRKVEKLIHEGYGIEIISEKDFLKMLSNS
jgi:DNA polymerase-3 subunit epsilon